MTVDVFTKDCTALSDAELGEMADLSVRGEGWEVGALSKQAEKWVLVSQAFDEGKLVGFAFTTLERIGGTPSLVIGVAAVARSRRRSAVLASLMHEQFHKTLMAFPDEDVVVATRLTSVGAFEALRDLTDVRPWPGERANGEERAWGRRLAKRFGAVAFDDRSMIATGDGEHLVFDHESLKNIGAEDVLADVDVDAGQHVIAWGWAMAEFLDGFQSPAS